jgi:dienelactone hydrolase
MVRDANRDRCPRDHTWLRQLVKSVSGTARRVRICVTSFAVFLVLHSPMLLAGDVTELPGLSRQTMQLTVPSSAGGTKTLDALVVRPDAPGPFPLALITHGLPRSSTEIPAMRPELYISPAIVFAQHGYAAVVVMRSGYGRSTGPFTEGIGPCEQRTYLKAGNAAGADVLSALSALQREPWVDRARVLLIGHSMGGFAVLAASASNPPGVLGTISFAGAVGSPRPNHVCQPDSLIDADRTFGTGARIPSLWIFAANDDFFSPTLARAMLNAYVANGAPASLFEAPSFGRNGHLLIWSADGAAWWPRVAAFLRTLDLPTNMLVPLPEPRQLVQPAPLDDAGRDAFANYVPSRSYEKAFATDAAGHYGVVYGQRTKTDAIRAALENCEISDRRCAIYAVDNNLVQADLVSGSERGRSESIR